MSLTPKQLRQAKKSITKKELAMHKICEDCGNVYRGYFARFYFAMPGTKKKKIIKGVKICDECLEKRKAVKGVWADRTKNI